MSSILKNLINIKKIEFRKQFVLIAILSIAGIFFVSIGSHAQALQTAPDPPIGLSAIAISPTSVSLSWSPPQNNGNATITNYRIEYKSPPGDYLALSTIGNLTKYTHTGLATGKTYIYRVFAINSVGYTSNPSSEAVATPKTTSTAPANIPPNPPTKLNATVYSATQINLSWIAPISNNGYPITGYKILYKIDSGSFTTLVSNTGNSYTAYSHTGLITGHTYSYQVYAINLVGNSSSSNTATATPSQANIPPPPSQANTAPYPPINLRAFPASATSIGLSWNAPQNSGGSTIIGYKIEYKSGSNPYSVLIANTASPATSYTHTGLSTGTTYTYRVSAINCISIGNPSNEISAVPAKTFTPTVAVANPVSPTQIYLSWTPPSETYGQTITGYKIDRKLSSNVFDTVVENTGPTTSYSISNLATGKTYTFTVTAIFSNGVESNPSPEASVTTSNTSTQTSSATQSLQQCASNPDPPTGLYATAASLTSIKLSWIAPSNNGGSPITGYKIEFKTSSGSWSVLAPNTGNSTTYIQTGLNSDTYTYRVSTINFIGISNPSREASVILYPKGSTTPPTSSPPEFSGGSIAVTNTNFLISYNIVGDKVLGTVVDKDTFSLHIKMGAKSDGVLLVQLPRDLIDAKKSDGSDDVYYVLADKQPVKFNETKAANYRTLAIDFPAQTSEIAIYGTYAIPEFPLTFLALIIALIPAVFFSRLLASKKLA